MKAGGLVRFLLQHLVAGQRGARPPIFTRSAGGAEGAVTARQFIYGTDLVPHRGPCMRKAEKLSRTHRVALIAAATLAVGLGVAVGAWAQNSILNPNVGIGTSTPIYFMDVNGGGGGGLGAPPGLNIRVPNVVGQFNGFRFSTATSDGPIAGF